MRRRSRTRWLASAGLALGLAASLSAVQVSRQAPANAPSSGRLAPAGEPGRPLSVSGVIVDEQGAPIAGASLYVYQTDAEGYYGIKPESDSRNPRLRLLLRSARDGTWSFETIRPGSYPGTRAPGHIHFEVAAPGFASRIFEIVFEGDPFVTAEMRRNPVFSVRPIDGSGRVTDRIVLRRSAPGERAVPARIQVDLERLGVRVDGARLAVARRHDSPVIGPAGQGLRAPR